MGVKAACIAADRGHRVRLMKNQIHLVDKLTWRSHCLGELSLEELLPTK